MIQPNFGERLREARIIKAEAELEAAVKLSAAAAQIMANPAALELRRMQMMSICGSNVPRRTSRGRFRIPEAPASRDSEACLHLHRRCSPEHLERHRLDPVRGRHRLLQFRQGG